MVRPLGCDLDELGLRTAQVRQRARQVPHRFIALPGAVESGQISVGSRACYKLRCREALGWRARRLELLPIL